VISSADLDEIAALCHRVLVLRDGRLVAHLAGESLSVRELTHAVLGMTQEGLSS
jgi:ribose transport system ATP-binding protein